MGKVTRILVDSDVYAYSAGGATQHTSYDCGALLPDGTVEEIVHPSMDAVRAWRAEEWPEGTEFVEPVRLVHAEPESHAIHLVKRSLHAVERAMDLAGIEYTRLELFMTGSGNFREKVATIKGYKANRDRNERPVHYKAIRRYLTRAWDAVTVEGMEADDILSIISYQNRHKDVVIVSQDKDLKNVPGRHFNARTKTWTEVTPEMARLHFYRQLITGDTVDNISGCYKAGPKVAESLTESMSESEMYSRCLRLYQDSLGKKGCLYAHMSAEDALLENARLLHLLRSEGDLWTPPESPSHSTSTTVSSTTPCSSISSGTPESSSGTGGTRRARRTTSSRTPASTSPISSTASSL